MGSTKDKKTKDQTAPDVARDAELEAMLALVRDQDMCVLATAQGGRPHTSLMAYAAADGGRALYMVTQSDSAKFANIQANAEVSALIDTRIEDRSQRYATRALTVHGSCRRLGGDAAREALSALTAAHPHLADFAASGTAVALELRVRDLQLLSGVEDATYRQL